MKLLLAEDTRDLNQAVTAMFTMQNYTVDSVYDGEEALDKLEKNGYDVIILDIMMPKRDGLSVLKEIRARNIVTPVLMLTAKSDIDDRVAGLDMGADDYIVKPFAMKELIARVNAMTRRRTQYSTSELTLGNVTLKAETQELKAENSVRLSIKELELLQVLILNKDRAVSAEFILEHVWPEEPDTDENAVWLYINYLKNKLDYINSNLEITGKQGDDYQILVRE